MTEAITERPEPDVRHHDVAREWAPSVMATEEPVAARWLGGLGLTFFLVGLAVVVLNGMGWKQTNVGINGGALLLIIGLVGMLYHAASDADLQIRRAYLVLGFLWLAGAVFATVYWVPQVGTFFLRFGFPCFALAFFFLLAAVRHETEVEWRKGVFGVFTFVGIACALAGLTGGMTNEAFLLSQGIPVSILGLVYLWGLIASQKSDDDASRKVVVAVGIVMGLVGLAYLFGTANQHIFAVGITTAVLALVYFWAYSRSPEWLESVSTLVALGTGTLGLLTFSVALVRWLLPTIFPAVHTSWGWTQPGPFLASVGIIQMAIGLLYLAVAVGLGSENRFVVLTRRELAAFFFSPLAYFIVFGFAVMAALQFGIFVDRLSGGAMSEPIIIGLVFSLIPVFWMVLAVPLLTMRLFSEEQRSGTMEVLLTAPVTDLPIVLSKFIAVSVVYFIGWGMYGLFLIALRVEGGQAFDYRPILSFGVALLCSGSSFLAMGLFFSSVTRNQIVAGVLTAAAMLAFVMLGLLSDMIRGGSDWLALADYVSFIQLWQNSLQGKLALRDVAFHISATIVWLFATLKVLESRKWR